MLVLVGLFWLHKQDRNMSLFLAPVCRVYYTYLVQGTSDGVADGSSDGSMLRRSDSSKDSNDGGVAEHVVDVEVN